MKKIDGITYNFSAAEAHSYLDAPIDECNVPLFIMHATIV